MRQGTWRRGSRFIALLVAVTALAAVIAPRSEAASADPVRALAFGAFAKPRNGQTLQQSTAELETQIGRKLEVVRVFETWEQTFPDSYHQWLRDGDRTVILSVKPVRNNGTAITWRSLADAPANSALGLEIRSWARRVRDFDAPIYVTLHHEPEASANIEYGEDDDYIAAWRHWVDVFRAEGATNVRFMWITTDYGHAVATSDRRYTPKWYPGDDWVDSMAIDAYNWHVCRPNQDNEWKTLAEIIEPFREFGELHPTKPLWLTEWASWEDPLVTDRKADWIDEASTLFAQPDYSQFVGVSYFNSDPINPTFDDCQWRVDTSASSLASFAAMAKDPLWSGDAFGDGTAPGPIPPVARFTSSCVELTCTFTSASTDDDGTLTQSSWQFGDATVGSGAAVQHVYVAVGTYNVTLTVTDDDGETDSVDHDVTVVLPPPTTTPPTTTEPPRDDVITIVIEAEVSEPAKRLPVVIDP